MPSTDCAFYTLPRLSGAGVPLCQPASGVYAYAEAATPEDIEKVKTYLADLNEKMNILTKNAAKTVDEYYDRVAFSNRIRVLIPASVKEPPIISKIALFASTGTIVVVLCVYLTLSLVAGIKEQEPQRHTEKSDELGKL